MGEDSMTNKSRELAREEAQNLPPLTFILPEYHMATVRFFESALHALMRAKDPILKQIKTENVEHIPNSQVTTNSGKVVRIEPILNQMEFPLTLMDAVKGNLNCFVAGIDEAAESALPNLMSQVFERMGKMCDATGNTINAHGQPITHDLMLRMIENLEMRFDEDGNHNVVLVLPPNVIEQLKSLPPPTPEQNAKWGELMSRKLREYNEGRRQRQMS